MKVMVAGATGLVGQQVVTQLLGDPRCTGVVAPTRRPLALHDTRLVNPVLDFEQLRDAALGWPADAVICALGTTLKQAGSREAFTRVDHTYPVWLAQAAREHGTPTFVLNSAMGADPTSRFFYNRVKGALESDLEALGFVSLTLVRPGLIGGQRAQRRTGEHLATLVLSALAPVLPRRYRINPATRIAQAMVQAALAPTPGRHVVEAGQLVSG